MLSLFICGTAVTSQYLAEQYQVNTPMLQSFINYVLLLLVYTTILAFRTGMWNMGREIMLLLFFFLFYIFLSGFETKELTQYLSSFFKDPAEIPAL